MCHETANYETVLVWLFDSLRDSVVMEELLLRDIIITPLVTLVEMEDFRIRCVGTPFRFLLKATH